MDRDPKQFVKNSSNDNITSISNGDEGGREEDDPLSLKDASITFIGIILAFMAVLIPSASVLLERPLFQKDGVISNQGDNKNGY